MSIVLENISKRLSGHLIVDDVSLEIRDGELFVLLGASGSGKSTLLRMIAGLISADSGRILLHDLDVTHLPPQQRGIGLVFQDYSVFRHMSVADNIEFGLRLRKVPAQQRIHRRNELLDLVGLSGLGNRPPHRLSGGQQQRVALARALAYEPSVLLLDEPFGALDVKIRGQLRRNLKRIQRRLGVTTILVTHDQEEAFELADRIGVLDRGRLLEIADSESLYYRPKTSFAASFVGGGTVVVGRVSDKKGAFGTLRLALPAGVNDSENRRIQLVVRPEQVELSEEPPTEPGRLVGRGEIIEEYFTGSIRRARLRLPRLLGTRQIAPPPPFGEDALLVDAVVPAYRSFRRRDLYVSLRDWHIIEAPPLRLLILDSRESDAEDPPLAAWLTDRLDGSATILRISRGERIRPVVESSTDSMPTSSSGRVDRKLRPGNWTNEVLKELEETLYDMVVLACPGESSGVTGGWKEGSELLDELLKRASFPVLVAPEGWSGVGRMMICTGAGEPGKHDVLEGGRLARRLAVSVVLFHVVPSGRSVNAIDRAHLERAAATLRSLDLEVDLRIQEEDSVSSAIVQEARRSQVNLIVVGRHLDEPRLFGGQDITRRVLEQADRPVLVIPAQERPLILPDAPPKPDGEIPGAPSAGSP